MPDSRGRRRRLAQLLAAGGGGMASGHRKQDVLSQLSSISSCSVIRDSQGGMRRFRVNGHAALCDMSTDGGGWTMVASGRAPPADYGGSWYRDLTTLRPQTASNHLWYVGGLDDPINDFRFSCAAKRCHSETNCTFDVDLAFYQNPWYRWIARTEVTEYARR